MSYLIVEQRTDKVKTISCTTEFDAAAAMLHSDPWVVSYLGRNILNQYHSKMGMIY